ncbi:MAG: substrate-binding domain-containing protein [Polyangiaceae bacterium]
MDHLDYLFGGYATQARCGLEEAAEREGFWLDIYVGHELGQSPESRIYELACSTSADGLIILPAGLASHSDSSTVNALLEAQGVLPSCSLGAIINGIPSIVADNRPGLETLLDHLIVHHGRRRLLCLAGHQGNPDSAIRFRVYLECLEKHCIEFDSTLVATQVLDTYEARRTVQRVLARGTSFDAVVAFNDAVALGALEALTSARIRVPEQVSLTGFDDVPFCRFTQPPLTTVRQPTRAMAKKALELVAAQLRGESVPQLTAMPVQAILRASCGCASSATNAHRDAPRTSRIEPSQWFDDNARRIEERLEEQLDSEDPHDAIARDATAPCIRTGVAG